jgi:hypothetical protein
MDTDAILRVRFKTTSEGGRQTDLDGDYYSCPLFVDGRGFECRIFIKGLAIRLGVWYELPVKFMNKDLVFPLLSKGKSVDLWEGKVVASGTIAEVFPHIR